MAKYVYPAIFSPSEDGGFDVSFPDVSGCYTEGATLAEAVEQAKDALCLMLYDMEERGETLPVPTNSSLAANTARQHFLPCPHLLPSKIHNLVNRPLRVTERFALARF